MSKTLLAIDASTEALSIALRHQQKVYHFFEVCPQQHSQRILPELDKLMGEAGISLNEVDVIGYCEGPGSFTGVRISVSITQGLAFSTNTPVVGVSSLALMAQQAIEQHQAQNVLSAIDARMNEVYLAQFSNENGLATAVADALVLAPEKVTLTCDSAQGVGTGWAAYPQLAENLAGVEVNEQVTLPDSRYMFALIEAELAANNAKEAAQAQPAYVRDTVTWKKLPGRE